MRVWTEERISELRRLCAEGLSYAEIGTAIGVSRNAALGKAHRIGVGNGIPANHGRQNGGRPKKVAIVAAPEIPPLPDPDPADRIKMLKLESHHCRFPFGDPQTEEFGFCGRVKAPGRAYCEAHAARCYVAPSTPPRAYDTNTVKSAADTADTTPDLVADIEDEKAQAA